MINFLLFLLAIPGLVLLYLQWKVKEQQENLIKSESESLKKLQKKNNRYVESGLFGLQLKSSYLQPSSESTLPERREKLLSRHFRKSRASKEMM